MRGSGTLATWKGKAANIGGWQTHFSKATIIAPSSGPYSKFSCPRSQTNGQGRNISRASYTLPFPCAAPDRVLFICIAEFVLFWVFTVLLIHLSRLVRKMAWSTVCLLDNFHIIGLFIHERNNWSSHLDWGTWYVRPVALAKCFLQAPDGLRCHACSACRWPLVGGLSEPCVSWKKKQVLRSKLKCFATGPGGFEPWSLKRPWTNHQTWPEQ